MDIADWLRQLDLEQYIASFAENAIDWAVLPGLTADDLREIGVAAVGHRRKLLNAIAMLSATPRPEPSSSDEPAAAASRAERRQLTVMFCDIVGSTALATRLDPEDLRQIMGTYHRCCAEVVADWGGYLARYMGDGILAYFGYPQAHEDDAERAVRAGLALIDRIGNLGFAIGRLDVRVGIATGEVIVGDLIGRGEALQREVIGETPILAARLQDRAAPNTVLISDGTRRLIGELFEIRDAISVELKGFIGRLRVWQPLRPNDAASRFEALRATTLTPLVGREEEIELLMRRWARAREGNGQVVLISGEAGIGKSRIAAEFERRLHGVDHIRIRVSASPQHQDSTLYPVIVHLERAAGFALDDPPEAKFDKLDALLSQSAQNRVDTAVLFADLLSLPSIGRYPRLTLDPHSKRELTLAALIQQFEGLARKRLILLVVEDMHWLDPTSCELLELIVERIRKWPAVCVVTCRPESLPAWAAQAHVTVLSLRRFDEQNAGALIKNVAGVRNLVSKIVAVIVARTDGIPLFIEEMTKSFLESGVLQNEHEHFHFDFLAQPSTIPASLHALLLARLDRLAGAKEIAQVAAALGREFSFDLLSAVVAKPEDQLRDALGQLIDAGLIFRRGSPPRESLIFKHALVQDAAYSTLLRRPRQLLHERIALVLEEQFPDVSNNQPELLAHHFTQAGSTANAIEYWRKAGERALRRSANLEAVKHLTHGLDLVKTLDDNALRERCELEFYLALAPAVRGIKGHAAPETLETFAGARQRLGRHAAVKERMSVLYGLFGVYFVRGEHAKAYAVAREAATLADGHPDTAAQAQAASLLGHVLWAMGDFRGARDHLERALDAGPPTERRINDRQLLDNHWVAVLSFLAHTLWALGFPEQAMRASREAVTRARSIGHVPLTAFALHGEAFLNLAFGADPHSGERSGDEAVSYCVEHGITTYEHWSRFYQGITLARQRNPAAAIAIMSHSMEAAAADHAGLFRPLHQGHLALVQAKLGQAQIGLSLLDEAIALSAKTGEHLFDAELHRFKGELLCDMGRESEAEIEFDRALSVACGQSARLWALRAATSCARLRLRHGRATAARQLLAPVYNWFTEGFATPDLQTAKKLLDKLE